MTKLLLYLLFFFLATQLGRHFWFDFSYKLGSRVDYLAPTVYVTDVLVCLIIIVFLKRSRLASRQGVTLKKSLLFYCFTVLLFVAYWLFVIKENPYLLAYNLLKLAEMIVLGLIIAKSFAREDLPQIVKILNLSLILQVSLALSQVLVEKSGGLWIIGEREFSISTIGIARFLAPGGQLLLRGYGTFPHPNVLGGFCLLMLAANSWFVKGPTLQRWQGRTLNKIGLVFSLLGVWLSMSTVAIVLSQAFLAGLAFKYLKLPKSLKLLMLAVFILILAFSFQLFAKTESFSRRTALLAAAGEEFRTSPVFGIGLGNFIPAMPERPLDGRTYFWQPAHNIPALILAETGLVGFTVVCLLIWLGIKKLKTKKNDSSGMEKLKRMIPPEWTIKNLKINKTQNILITNYYLPITISWWLIIFITGLFDHYWLTLQQGRLMLALVAGLSFVYPERTK